MKVINTQLIFILLVLVLVVRALPAIATDYSGSNFFVRDPIISEGGTHYATSASYQLRATIGGVESIGESTSTTYKVKSGFQYYDDTAPDTSGAVVNDGSGADIDEQTSLNTIQANWSGFSDPESGLRTTDPYEYAIRRKSDGYFWSATTSAWQVGAIWYATSTTAISVTPVYLRTSETYYVSVRAYNNAGMVSSAVDSDGVKVTPSLSFSLSSTAVNFGTLETVNNFTATGYTTTTVSTNAYNGYIITAWATSPLTNSGGATIADWGGSNASPTAWPGNCPVDNQCGFGYSTNDNNLSGGTADRFTNSGPNYAAFVTNGPGDPVADHTAKVDGSTGAINSEQFVITYKVSVNAVQAAGDYKTTIVYVATPQY